MILVQEGAVTQHFYAAGGCVNSYHFLENLANFINTLKIILFKI
jgi:hypothetical protein